MRCPHPALEAVPTPYRWICSSMARWLICRFADADLTDRVYISKKLSRELRVLFNLKLIIKLKTNMKNQLMSQTDKVLLRKRAIIETIIDQRINFPRSNTQDIAAQST